MEQLKNHLTRVVLLIILAMLPQLASAYSDDYYCAYDFKADGLCYNFNADGTSVEVTYECQYYQYDEWSGELVLSNNYGYINLGGDIVIPKTVNYNGNTYSVTSIGDCAFYNCSGLTSVTIGNSVTSIGNNAFKGCSGLTSVTIPNSVTSIGGEAFKGCSGLTSVTIPNSVTSIGNKAFYNCSGLTSVTIPNSVTSIGNKAFYNCSGLISIFVDSGNAKYDSRNNCNAIIETATNILIIGCKSTVIPNSVTSISNWAFRGCSGLTSIDIPNSVTEIGDEAFEGCSDLTSIDIPNSVTSIGKLAFSHTGLTELTIPHSLTSIGGAAFANCDNLRTVHWNAKICSIDNYYYSYSEYDDDDYYDKMGPPIGYTETGYSPSPFSIEYHITYYHQSHVESYERVESDGITDFIFGDEVETIPSSLCKWLDDLSSVVIPNSVTSIGDYAFSGFSGLTSVYSKIRDPQSVQYGENIFCIFYEDGFVGLIAIGEESNFDLYVPHGKREVYEQTSPWNHFDIIEMDPTGDVNDDGKVNVTDYVATAGYILEMDPQPFYFEECDFNENGIISVGDLVGVATRVLSFEGAPMLAPAVGVTEAPSIAMAADVNGRDGSYEVTINLSNNVDLTALQMDLDLPAGMTLASATLSDRASESHQVAFNQLGNGDYRLLASSPMCKAFTGNDGAVLTLTLAGEPSGNGVIRNIELATPRAASYEVDDIELNLGTTGVETVKTDTRIYSDGGNIIIDSPTVSTAQIVLPNGISQTVTVTAGKNVFPAPSKGMIIVKMGDSIKKLQLK